jgi:hypothetical protein
VHTRLPTVLNGAFRTFVKESGKLESCKFPDLVSVLRGRLATVGKTYDGKSRKSLPIVDDDVELPREEGRSSMRLGETEAPSFL